MTQHVLWQARGGAGLLRGASRVGARLLVHVWPSRAASLGVPAPRAAEVWDVFVYNVYFTSFALALVYLYGIALQVAAPSSLVPGVLVAGGAAAPVVATYALLSAAMPRAGGDYVYVGQVLGRPLGFLVSWNWVVWLAFWIGFGGYTFSVVGLRGWLVAAALGTGRPHLLGAARVLSRGDVAFLVGTAVITAFCLLVNLGMGTFLRVQRWTFALAVVALALTVSSLARTHPEDFAERFDRAVLSLVGARHAYLRLADSAGGVPGEYSPLSVVPAAFLVLPWTLGSTFIAPEVKDLRRTQPLSMLAALATVTGATALLGDLLVRTAGAGFLLGLAAGAAERLGVPLRPYLGEVALLALGHPWLLAVAAAGFLCLGWMYVAQNVINSARVLMAWARDGLAPSAWAEVHPRLHVPWRATLAVTVAGEAFLAFLCFAPSLHLLSSILALSLSAALTCLSAVLLPFRRPELLRGAGARRVGRVPLLSLLGACGLGVLAYVDVRYLLDSRYGVNNPGSLVAVGVVLATGAAYYRWARRRQETAP